MTIQEYIDQQEASIQPQLKQVYESIKTALPDTAEKFSYGMPTFWQGHNLVHFATQKKHIGLYSEPDAVAFFEEHLQEIGLKYSKGTIQIPYDEYLPLELIHSIAEWCAEQEEK